MRSLQLNTPITIFKKRIIYLSFLAFFATFFLTGAQSNDRGTNARDVLNQVFNQINSIQTLYYSMVYKEKVYESSKIRFDSSIIKFQKLPRRVYIKVANGTELLWGPDINDGDILVHPNSFPYFNLNLNPNGYFIRKNQHHGIDEAGFDSFKDLVKAAMVRAGNDFDSHFFYQGEVNFNGFRCQEVLIIDAGFKYVPYTVQKGEDIISIAHTLCLNAYMIFKHNPKLSSYTDVKAGQVILVPSNYAEQVKLYIDETTLLPVFMRVDDEKGLFEEYSYKSIKLNPNFSADEFSKNNKEYHF